MNAPVKAIVLNDVFFKLLISIHTGPFQNKYNTYKLVYKHHNLFRGLFDGYFDGNTCCRKANSHEEQNVFCIFPCTVFLDSTDILPIKLVRDWNVFGRLSCLFRFNRKRGFIKARNLIFQIVSFLSVLQ